jgi:hypothetical protein
MDWVKWLIPLVVVFVIILSNLARIAQDEKKQLPRRRPRPNGERDATMQPRRPTSEVERFLDEVNRRRRADAAGPRPPLPPRPPAVPPRVVAERPASRDVQDLPAAVLPVAAAPVDQSMPTKRPPREMSPPTERRGPTPAVEEILTATVVPFPPGSAPAPAATAATGTAPVVARKPDTATAVMLLKLLRSPASLKTAVVLREVLDGPLCRRHRSV